MAINTQTIRIDLNPDRSIPVAYSHQGDTARSFMFEVYNNGEAFPLTGYTAKIAAMLPADDGYRVIAGDNMADGAISENTITATLPADFTAKPGRGVLTIVLTGSGATIRPINIDLRIQKSADAPETIAGASDFVPVLQRYMAEDMQTYINAWLDAHPEAMQYYISGSKLVLDENGILSIQNDTDEIVEALDLDTLRAEVTDLKSELNQSEKRIKDLYTALADTEDLTVVTDWEQGSINTSTGEDSDLSANKRIRSALFSADGDYVYFQPSTGYGIMVFFYSDGVYKDRTGWVTTLQRTYNQYNGYRVMIRSESSADVKKEYNRDYCHIYYKPKWTDEIEDLQETASVLSASVNTLDSLVYENQDRSANRFNIGNSEKMVTPTYDGSNQATHPSVVYVEDGYLGYKWWLGITPYPASNDDYENPQILVSNDGLNFNYFPDCPNPLDELSASDLSTGAHNSDIDICLVDSTMYCFWRYTDGNGKSVIYERHTTDGTNWTTKQQILAYTDFENEHAFYSPAFLYDASTNKWKVWFTSDIKVDDLYRVWYTVGNSGFTDFSEPIPCLFGNETLTRIWHQDVIQTGSGYEFVGSGYKLSDGYTDGWRHQRLFYSRSTDGVNWENLREFMHRTTQSWDNKSLYRPTFCYVNGVCHLFYSASTLGYAGTTEKDAAWGIGHAIGSNPTAVVGLLNNGKKKIKISLNAGQMIFDSGIGYPVWRLANNLMWANSAGTEIDKYWTD